MCTLAVHVRIKAYPRVLSIFLPSGQIWARCGHESVSPIPETNDVQLPFL